MAEMEEYCSVGMGQLANGDGVDAGSGDVSRQLSSPSVGRRLAGPLRWIQLVPLTWFYQAGSCGRKPMGPPVRDPAVPLGNGALQRGGGISTSTFQS